MFYLGRDQIKHVVLNTKDGKYKPDVDSRNHPFTQRTLISHLRLVELIDLNMYDKKYNSVAILIWLLCKFNDLR